MNTLFARLLRSYVVVLLTAILVIGGTLTYFYAESLFAARQEELVENGQLLAAAFEESLHIPQSPFLLRTRVEAIAQTLKAHITIANREGLITLTTYDERRAQRVVLSTADVRQVLEDGAIITRRGYEESLQEQMVTALVPVHSRNNVVGAVVLHAPVRGTIDALRSASRLLLLAGGFAAAAGVLVSYVLSRRIVAPIRVMTAASKEMAQGNFERRVQVEGATEIAALADAFNRLAEQLDQTISALTKEEHRRRDFLANVSHELRTPLTSIRGFAQALMEGVVTNEDQIQRYLRVIMDESLRLIRLVNTLLDLSRLESNGVTLHFEEVDLDELIRDSLSVVDPLRRDRNLDVDCRIDPLPPIVADRDRLAQVWLNLLDNAIRHADKGSVIGVRARKVSTVSTDGKSSLDCIAVDIDNQGSAIPEEELPHIWDRFHKVDKARQYRRGVGTGLGLVIVKELVERHGGTVAAANLPEGRTRFTVTLPIHAEGRR